MDRTMANSQQLAMDLNETIASGDWRLLFTNYEEIRRVTPDDVVRVAKLYFKPSNRTVGVFIPDAAPERTAVPDAPPIDAAPQSLYARHSRGHRRRDRSDPPRRSRGGSSASRFPAACASRCCPRARAADASRRRLTLRFGDEHSLAGKNAAAQMTDALLMRGTTTRTRQQLQDEMQKLNATINVGGGGGRGGGGGAMGSVSASITTTAENLVPALALAVDILERAGVSRMRTSIRFVNSKSPASSAAAPSRARWCPSVFRAI